MSSPIRIAQRAAEQYIRHGEIAELSYPLPAPLASQRACYVTLYENPGRHVRAMFGRPSPAYSTIAQEITMNTVEAIRRQGLGQSQQRSHMRVADLPYLGYSVAVVGPLERVLGSSHLSPARFGLYVLSDRGKSAIILPQRTGIETGDEQISTAFREGNISADEAVTMYRFSVTHYD